MQIELTRQQAMDLATEIFRQLAADPAADVVVDVPADDDGPDWSNLPPGAVHVAGAVRDAKPTAQPYTHFRADGWPLCPNCGQDELWSDVWTICSKKTMAEGILTIQGCYACHWSPELERDGN